MMTVHEVSRLSGVSIRTLQYYDSIGLLKPSDYTESGYRLYDDTALERLQMILLFRELEFPLKEIQTIIESPCFDRKKALEQQIQLLMLKKEHIENLISLARGIKNTGVNNMANLYKKNFELLKGNVPMIDVIEHYLEKYQEYDEHIKTIDGVPHFQKDGEWYAMQSVD